MTGEIPQPNPNSTIKAFVEAEGPEKWEHTQTLKWLYGLHDVITSTWFAPRDESQLALPQAVLAIDNMDVRTLAAFRLTANPNGLPNEIIMNRRWIERPKWELAESLVHETVHLFQESMADKKVAGFQTCANTGHNKQFVEIAEEIGLHPKLGEGYHLRPADGQFERLMELIGVDKPDHAKTPPNGTTEPPKGYWWDGSRGKAKGTSTLLKYTAEDCPDTPKCSVRSGRKDIEIACLRCGSKFVHSH